MLDPCALTMVKERTAGLTEKEALPFSYHCRVGVGTPEAPDVNVAVAPTLTVVLVGCGAIAGGCSNT